jgi:hypothetical protein
MIYLFDVNALVALGAEGHLFHRRVATWLKSEHAPVLATCAITELGFVRVVARVPDYGASVNEARLLLLRLKQSLVLPFRFISDDHGADDLPAWVKTPRQTTDGHLAELARANGALLATLDRGVPRAYLIPE